MNTLLEFEQAADTNGYRIEELSGELYYVTVDGKGNAVIGPRAKRQAKSWRWPFRKRKEKSSTVAVRNVYFDGEAANPALVEATRVQTNAILKDAPRVNINMQLPDPPAPQEPQEKFLDKVLERVYDEDWHRAMRNTAKTAFAFMAVAFSALVFIKGALWVLSL